MKVKIYGNDLTPENFASVVERLNEDYKELGLRVKNCTCYFRFEDEMGKTVEPVYEYGGRIEQEFTFTRVKTVEEDTESDVL